MTLNASGPISLAGTVVGQSIQIELGGNGTTQTNIGSLATRTLAGVPSGQISLSNFYGKSNASTPPSGSITIRSGLPAQTFEGVAFGAGLFAAVSASGTIYTSPTGVTWTLQTTFAGFSFNSIMFANGTFVACGSISGSPSVVTSTNGTSWTLHSVGGTTGSAVNTFGCVYNGTQFVVATSNLGNNICEVATTTAFVTWTVHTITGSGTGLQNDTVGQQIAYGNGAYVINCIDFSNNGFLFHSTNLTTWASTSISPANTPIRTVGYVDSSFVAGGSIASKYLLYTSPDGSTWTNQQPTTGGLVNGVYMLVAGTYAFVTGPTMTTGIAFSNTPTNTATWSTVGGAAGKVILGIAYNSGTYVGVGTSGFVCTFG